MTTRNNNLSVSTSKLLEQELDNFVYASNNGPEYYDATSMVREARRLLGMCTRLRNALHNGNTPPVGWRQTEQDLAFTYFKIRSYQNALLRYLHEPELTTFPAWVNRCFR